MAALNHISAANLDEDLVVCQYIMDDIQEGGLYATDETTFEDSFYERIAESNEFLVMVDSRYLIDGKYNPEGLSELWVKNRGE